MFNMNDQTVLVTGGTGFVGIHILFQLLQQGYTVKTTLRSLSRTAEIETALRDAGLTTFERLSYYVADLNEDAGWAEAAAGCHYVLHVASPFPAGQPADENELIRPARDGALRVLKAARDAGVKRVVLTSSFAAIGYSNHTKGHVFTEQDWTDADAPIPAYIKSKTVAEKAAWDFIAAEGGALELSVINPVGIFGPVMGGISSSSIDVVVKGIIDGSTNVSPDFTLGVVDVRDVADIHLKAMVHPAAAGERFLATSDGVMSFYDVAQLIRQERPARAVAIAAMAPTDAAFYITLSNEKARTVLGWQPRTKEAALLASVDTV